MNMRRLKRQRRGTVLPMLATSIVVLMGFVALAIDLGMLANARVQAQNAADVTALTTLRTLNGNPDTCQNGLANQNGAYTRAMPDRRVHGRGANTLGPAGRHAIQIGSYSYSTSPGLPNFPAAPGKGSPVHSLPGGQPEAVQATVTPSSSQKTFFAGVFGVSAPGHHGNRPGGVSPA